VVRERCEAIGRDPSTLETSAGVAVIIDENVTAELCSRAMWPSRCRTHSLG
jgi:alkanesulfonate monooxygenase SsuD/methylene tetrahydromethanopterin reductase-like flavin-dependent oxidoreductase (luciferase family)